MEIIIKLNGITPKWVTLQKVLCECLQEDGRIVRINRPDRHCGYRDKGFYEVDFLTNDRLMTIKLTVE